MNDNQKIEEMVDNYLQVVNKWIVNGEDIGNMISILNMGMVEVIALIVDEDSFNHYLNIVFSEEYNNKLKESAIRRRKTLLSRNDHVIGK